MTYLIRQSFRIAVFVLFWVMTLQATAVLAQTTVVLPRSCKSCPLSTNGTGDITSYDNCSVASAGTLTSGTPASAVTQTIAVTVGKVGTYNLSAIANGVIFSASGSFTATGSQNVVLTGTGTPLAVGTYTYTLNTTPNCSFQRITGAGAASAKGAMTPCPGAFVNVKTFGMQRTSGNDGGGFTELLYDNIFLSGDGSTFYNTDGRYHDIDQKQSIMAYSYKAGISAVTPIHAIRQLFPGVTFKQFVYNEFPGSTGRYLFLLTSTNELHVVVMYLPPPSAPYSPLTGPIIGMTTTPAASSITAYNNALYSTAQITTPTMKFSSIWQGSQGAGTSPSGTMFGYNPADNLVYSWGGTYMSSASPITYTVAGGAAVLRADPTTMLASVTPQPATTINTILQRNGTTLKEMTDVDQTFLQPTLPYLNQRQASLVFIGKDGNVYRYFYDNQKNYKISLPGGVKAISVMYTGVGGYGDSYVLLGDDGKLYTDNLVAFAPQPPTNNISYLPTTNDQPITAVKFNSTAQVDALNITQIMSPWSFVTNTYAQSIGALTSDGTLYRIFDDTPNPLVPAPLSGATINITQRDGLPLFAKVFGCEEYTATNRGLVGQSKTTGNTIFCGFASFGSFGTPTADGGPLNGSNPYSGHFSDTGQFVNSNVIGQYVWFNCWDPWTK